jgi:hypothetical protein
LKEKKTSAEKRIIDFILHYYILSDFVGCYAGLKHYVALAWAMFLRGGFYFGAVTANDFWIAAPADIFWSAVA